MKFSMKEKPELEIKQVKMSCDDFDNDDKRIKSSLLPAKHSALYIVGPPASGKSNLIYQLLHNKHFYKRYFDSVNIWSPSLHTFTTPFKVQPESIHTEFSVDEINNVLEELDHTEKNLLLFDDFIASVNSVGKSGPLRKIFFNRRHKGVSIWITSQRYNLLDLSLRNNLSHLILFRISKSELELIHKEKISTISLDDFVALCDFVFSEPHSFLYVSLNPIKFFRNFNPISVEKSVS